MKWYKHDSNAHSDAKLKKVRMKYGLEGYGLYWYCIELITASVDADNITFELEHDAEIISHDTGIHYERVNEMMTYMVDLGLFENDNGVITCLKIAKRLDKSMTSNPKMREIIENIKNNHDWVMTESEKVMQDKTRLDKTRLDNNTPAKPKLTKADKLVIKVRSNPEKFVCLNCIDDELLIEWAKLRIKKNASDSDRALNKIESVLETLRVSMGIAPDQAIARQCDRGWTTVELEYFQSSKPANTMPAAQSNQETLSEVSMRTL